jgi:hypothetical protein
MLKLTFILILLAAGIIIPARFIVEYNSFMKEGIVSGLQSCKSDDECIWVATGCCDCEYGGGEMLVNENKEMLFNLLLKPLCLGENSCDGDNLCHAEDVFCDKTCKFGEKTYTKPLLSR